MTRIRVKVVTGDTFIFESELPESEAYASLNTLLSEGDFVQYAAGKFALNVAHIVSLHILA